MSETIELYTKWGMATKEAIIPLNDYPRPQLVRENWQNLNGYWRYDITTTEEQPTNFQGQILVPYSPESLLSQVKKNVKPTDTLWYQREFQVNMQPDERTILHFGAVDQLCEVWVNHKLVGKHSGGYWPFSFDITEVLETNNQLIVKVKDESDNPLYAYGKQKQEHGEIWYTPQSGIWQTVWLENVPLNYVTDIQLTPDFDHSQIGLKINCSDRFTGGDIVIKAGAEIVYQGAIEQGEVAIDLPNFTPWTPDVPFLYDLQLTVGQDQVRSYFGMRKFSSGINQQGHKVPLLNNQPIFYNGLLDQGYWSDGLYTPPSDEGMIWEIKLMKELGYNMLRKHIKIEPLRWYYHCDRLGMLVWQDFVSGGAPEYSKMLIKYLPYVNIQLKDNKYKWFRRESLESRQQFEIELEQTVSLLKNVTSLAVWVPFNEGWGQFDSTRIGDKVRQLDPTRLIDYVSGYHDQGKGDFKSPHIYYKSYRLKADKHDRIQILSEFGGYSCPTPNHMGTNQLFGYKMYQNKDDFTQALLDLYEKEIFPAVTKGLGGTVYTQVSDVEEEINGLITYDRQVLKVDKEKIIALNRRLYEAFDLLN